MFIVKRSGKREKFDPDKIRKALENANISVAEEDKISNTVINNIVTKVEQLAEEKPTMFNVDDIQDTIEEYLIKINKYDVPYQENKRQKLYDHLNRYRKSI